MPRNKGAANRRLSKTRAGQELSPWLAKLMADRRRPLARRSPISVTVPPLASYLLLEVGRIKRQSSQMMRWLTVHAKLTSTRVTRMSLLGPAFIQTLLKPPILLPRWQHRLDATLFRRHKRKTKFHQTMAFAPEERPINDDLRTDEVYPD